MATNYNAVKKLNQAKAQRQQELAQAYEELGGSNPAYKPIQTNNVLANPQRMTATIPQLEKAVMSAYEGNDSYVAGKAAPQRQQNLGQVFNRSTLTERSGGGGHHSFDSTKNINLDSVFKALQPNAQKPGSLANIPDYSEARQDYASLYNDLKNADFERRIQQARLDMPELLETDMGYIRPDLTPEMEAAGITKDDLDRYLDAQAKADQIADITNLAENHPVVASAMAYPARPVEGVIGNIQQIADRVQGKPLSQSYSPSTIMRNTVTENIDSNLGRIAYGEANSIGDMAMSLLIGRLLGGNNNGAVSAITRGIMGTEKSNDTMNEAIERNLTPNQVLTEGGESFLSTYITEALPLERIVGGGSNILGTILAEGGQEALEDIVDTLFDQATTISGGNVEKSELAQSYNAYREMGLSDKDAKAQVLNDYWDQLKLDAILGGISGGLMQGGTNAISGRNIVTGNLTNNVQNQIIESLNPNEVSPENFNQFSQNVDEMIEKVPEMAEKLDDVRDDVSGRIESDIKEAAEYVLKNPDINAYNKFVQNVSQIREQVPALQYDIDNILENFNNDFAAAASESLRRSRKNVIPKVDNIKTNVDNVKPNVDIPVIQNEVKTPEPKASRREVNSAIRTAEGVRDNLKMFKSKESKALQSRLDKAVSAVRNSTGQAQIQAINDLNNAVAEVNNIMNGEQIGFNEREFNRDGWQRMHNVTDGRKIKVTPAMLKGLNLSLTQLKNMTNTGTNNRINFYAADNPNAVSLDSVWNEMVEQSGNELPMVPEGDQLAALINYINEYKSGKSDEVNTTNWEDLQTDYRSETERRIDDIAEDILDKIDNGTITDEEIGKAMEDLTEISVKDKSMSDKAVQIATEISNAWRDRDLPEDIKAITTPEQAQQALDEELQGLNRVLSMDLGFFGDEEQELPTLDDRELNTGIYKDSKYATKTFPNSGIMTEEEQAEAITDDMKKYQAVTNPGTLEKAGKNLKANGYTNELNDLMNRKGWDAVDLDEAHLILDRAAQDARNAKAAGVDPKQAWKKSVDIFKKIRSEATRGGQMIQALKKWNISTPEGKLGQAIAYANDSRKKTSVDDNLLGQLDEAAKDNKVTFSDEFIQEFLEKAHSLDDLNPTKAQQAQLDIELAHMVLSQVPKKFRYKFTAFWMNNLLASARTLLTRNVGGNAGKWALDQTATKLISGPIDKLASKLTGERTTTGFTKEGFMAGLEGARRSLANTTKGYWFANAEPDAKFKDLVKDIKSLKENFTALEDPKLANREGVDEENFLNLIKTNRSTYNANNLKEAKGVGKVTGGIENVLKVYDKLIKYGLAISDDPFYSFTYNQTLNELNQIRDNPDVYGGSFSKIPKARFDTFAKAMATAKGLEAVYQDNTKMSDGAMEIKEGVGKITEDMLGIDLVSNPLFPFVRTPMNVIRTNLEYNPLGIVKNVINTIKEIRTNLSENRSAFDKKSFDQVRFVRETSRNVVGGLLWIAGLALAHAGVLSGAYSKNDKEKQAQKEAGMQEYAFVNPLNGNQSSIDWLPATGSTLTSAAAFYDAYNRNNEGLGQAFAGGMREGAKSLFEMSALQGLQRLTGSGYNSDKNVVDNAIQSLANTASSAVVPAFVRQIAQAIDPYKRDTYSGDDKEDFLAALKNNIPVLRETLQPRIGSDGEPLAQNPGRTPLEKWYDNLLNPATTTVPSALQDPTRDEAVRIHEATGLYTGYQPKIERDYLAVNGYEPTAEDLSTFATNANAGMHNAAEEIIGTEYYQSLSDEDKGNLLSNIYKYVRDAERTKLLNLDPDELEGAARAYYDNGQDGLLDYLTASSMLSRMDSDNNDVRREAALNTISGMDSDEINDLIDDYVDRRDSAVEEIDGLMSDMYSGMSESDAKQLQREVYAAVRSAELYQALGMDLSNLDGAAAAYLDGGTQGVRDYYYARNALNQMGMANNPANRQNIIDLYNEGGDKAVQQLISDSQALASLDFGTNMTKRYQHATNYIPSLNPQSFYDLFTEIDTVDPEKESITQSELLTYFDNHNLSEQEAMDYWLAFGPSTPWSSIPVLNNDGTWSTQRTT